MPELKFHHIGLVTPDIETTRQFYQRSLGYRVCSEIIHDPLQSAHVQFLALPGAEHYLELVAPDGPDSKLTRVSRRGIPLHHLCYSTVDIQDSVSSLANAGCLMIQDPVPAIAFGGRCIAWLLSPDQLLLELVERGPPGSL